MHPDLSLRENVIHGTKEHPLRAMHFTAGPKTPYPDHFFVKRHWHNYVEILCIAKGSYLFEINLQNYILEEGDLCILNGGEPHQITGREKSAVHDVLLFNPQILNFSYEDEWQTDYMAPFLEGSLLIRNILHPREKGYPELLSCFRHLMEQGLSQKPGWYLSCKLELLRLFETIIRHQLLLPAEDVLSASSTRKIQRYKKIVSYMEAHYQEPLSLEELSGLIGYNSQYLCRFFREISGVSPIQYLISYRLEKACALLEKSARPVTEIALDCGFENISYFIRKFRENKGCTPGEYRKACPETHRQSSAS